MSERWTWRPQRADGTEVAEVAGGSAVVFPTQVDAEAWLGESWEEMLDAGVDRVTLCCDGAEVYGPMGLRQG